MTTEFTRRINLDRHKGTRLSLHASTIGWTTSLPPWTALLSIAATGVDVSTYLNPADVMALRDACNELLEAMPAATQTEEAA